MTRIHHVALFVSNMERALHLFQNILGLKPAWHAAEVKGNRMASLLGIPEIKMEIVYLQNGPESTAVELCRMIHPVSEKPPQPFGSPGGMSLSLQVKDLDLLAPTPDRGRMDTFFALSGDVRSRRRSRQTVLFSPGRRERWWN